MSNGGPGSSLGHELGSAATSILMRAVELDQKKRYTEAMICYQEGLQLLINLSKSITDAAKKDYLRGKVEDYMNRAETLKRHIEKQKALGNYREQVVISDGSTGHSYESVFGRFLDEDVDAIEIEDPYIRTHHQCQNFLRFCELAVKKCPNLSLLRLVTTLVPTSQASKDQKDWFDMLSSSLAEYKIKLMVDVSDTLHDRTIRVSNGWVIKIGRGLDYFKAPGNKFSIGAFEMNLRKCHETVVDIFHSKNVQIKQS